VSSEVDFIKGLVAEVCATQVSAIATDRPLIAYGLDSARAIDLLVGLENEFDLRIPDEDARTMRTIDDIVRYVRARAPKPSAT
jgi:acyl carrier protein